MGNYAFGPFLLDVNERKLVRGNQEIRIRARVFDTLCVLVDNAGRLVRKDELMRAVWSNATVEENNLDYCVSQLRKLLRPANYIETVPRYGYRFVAEVQPVSSRTMHLSTAAASQEFPEPEIRFFTASDGVRIAYTIGGQGPVLIQPPTWLGHIGYEWKNPGRRRWLSEIMTHNTLVRYDQRGSGLSDWNVNDLSFERLLKDFEELIEVIDVDTFAILGRCQGAAIAMAYAAKNPEQVSKLILSGAFANGWPLPTDPVAEHFDALLALMRSGWGRDNPAFRQLWTSLFRPDATPEEMEWLNEMQRVSASPENAVRIISEFPKIKVFDYLQKISCPALVLHVREDAIVPVEEGKLIASRIPSARFVELPGRSHVVVPEDPGWSAFVKELSAFLGWSVA